MPKTDHVREGHILTGPIFNEPMRVVKVTAQGRSIWVLDVVGMHSERFRSVTLTAEDIAKLTIRDPQSHYDGNGTLLRLGLQAYALGIAFEFDPYFGLSISRVDPLPHQLEAVYDYLLKLPRVRFLLADDPGAGKTIMAGLLIRELKLRGLAERIIIVCPANLAFQWQREMKEKFEEKFVVMRGGDLREQFGVNQWIENPQVITSLDLAKRSDILPGLEQVKWDLAIVDEAHRMSWTPPSAKTARYALGELLRDGADHYLLLTATPHKGNPENFSRFLQLLDQDAYADVVSIQEAMERQAAPFYLRRTKEAMVYFPERQPDGTWVARKIFTRRIPHTVAFEMQGAEFDLYRNVTRFVKQQSARAAAQGDDPRTRAVGFLMALYQRRLASSSYAVRRSLEKRAKRIEDGLTRAQDLVQQAPPVLPEPDELEEMEEGERERLEEIIEAVTLSRNAGDLRQEIAELQALAQKALEIEGSGEEAKLARLRELLLSQGFSADGDERLLIFTEFKDTLDYLGARFKDWGFRVGFIHGGMKSGSRDEPGTRLFSEQQFREGGIQVLVATEAAGEGINLQCCHILFNYDIPWNPNRLEQRMGRIHRYGQEKDCLIFNFVAINTIEGRVLQRLLDKLQEIRDALDDDAVFNVVGEVLPAAHIERVLRDYYAGKLGEADLEERLLRDVDEERFRSICQNALEGLATKKLNLEMLIERRALAQERRVVPETIARFIGDAAREASLPLRFTPSLLHTFEPGRTPLALRRHAEGPTWKLPPVSSQYPRCSTDRDTATAHNLEWVTPGHPLFEALRRHSLTLAGEHFSRGACFHSLEHEAPARVDFYRARIVDGRGNVVREHVFAVELGEEGPVALREPGILGNFMPAAASPSPLPPVADLPEALDFLHGVALAPFLAKAREEREAELARIAKHIEMSLTELLAKADQEIGNAEEEVRQGIHGAQGRLAQAETRHGELQLRRDRRRRELEQEQALTLQGIERLASVLVLPHPEREAPEVRRLRPDLETEAVAMRVVMEHEQACGRQVFDVHEQNLGYDLTSLDLASGALRLIEVKGLAGPRGSILLTPNERRVAEDRRDCYWLYIVTECGTAPCLQEPVNDPARFPWNEVKKIEHYWLSVNAMTRPMEVCEPVQPFGEKT